MTMHWRTLDGAAPEVIAHRGASGLLPEHTLAGYALGLQQAADLIEPDLVVSADGVLFCRHDPTLARSTDIAQRSEFADRCDGDDWPLWQLGSGEIDRLRAIQPQPGRSRAHDGFHPVPRFSAMLAWAAEAARQRGRDVVLYPEIKHPSRFAELGCDPLPPFIAIATAPPRGVQLRVQCFEAEPLRRICQATGLPGTLLLQHGDDWRAAIARHGGWLSALGVDKRLLHHDGCPGELVDAAHAAGLRVDAWTFRDDAPPADFGDIDAELRAAFALGVDGVFCDFPATAVAVRQALIDAGG